MKHVSMCCALGMLFLTGGSRALGQSTFDGTLKLAFSTIQLYGANGGTIAGTISTNLPAQCEIITMASNYISAQLYTDSNLLASRKLSFPIPSSLQSATTLLLSIRATSGTGVTIWTTVSVSLPAITQVMSITKFSATASSRQELVVDCVTNAPATLQVLGSAWGSAESVIYTDTLLSTARTLKIPIPSSLQALSTLSVRVRVVSESGVTLYSSALLVPLPAATFTTFKAVALSQTELQIEVATSSAAVIAVLASGAGVPESLIMTTNSESSPKSIRVPLPSSLQKFDAVTVRAKTMDSGSVNFSSSIVVSRSSLTFTTFKTVALSRSELQVEVATSSATPIEILAAGAGVVETKILTANSEALPKTIRVPVPSSLQSLSQITVRACQADISRPPVCSSGISVILPAGISGELLTAFDVKEVAGVGAKEFPVRMVVPLPKGQYQATDKLQVVDMNNIPVVSTVSPLTRYWTTDGSVRFASVDFLATVSAFAGAGSGTAKYRLLRVRNVTAPVSSGVTATESGATIEVTNRWIKLVINKTQFRIISEAYLDANQDGAFEPAEKLIDNTSGGSQFRSAWGTQYGSAARSDVRYTIEENGPVRVVVKAEAPTRYVDMMRYEPGFAVRIFAYADTAFVKIDYQLQAGALDLVYAGALYFDELSLDFDTPLPSTTSQVTVGLQGVSPWVGALGSGVSLRQSMHNQAQVIRPGQVSALASASMAAGYLDVSGPEGGVTAFIRDFWQKWPNGLEALPGSAGTRIRVKPFPEWGSQLYKNNTLSTGGVYWLDDMMATYKEAYLFFHLGGTDSKTIENLTATMQHYPVGVLPYEWYRQTNGVPSFGDFLPASATSKKTDLRRPDYTKAATAVLEQGRYPYGWINYGDPEPGYRDKPCTTGGFAYGRQGFIMSGDPRDYYDAHSEAMAEINTRPEWLSGYSYQQHWPLLQLSDNGYCNGSWRKHISNAVPKTAYPYLSDTQKLKGARDDEHAWFYHVEEAYYLTGDPWIKDWYRFIGEYRKTRLNQKDPYPDMSSRAIGHSVAHALQAWRVTGDASLLVGLQNYVDKYLRPNQDRLYGDQSKKLEPLGGGFQTGYLARTIADYMNEIGDSNTAGFARTFAYLTGLIEWNYNYGNFSYYFNATGGGISQSSGTASTLLDPVAWYATTFGKKQYLDQALQYDAAGINGGSKPYAATGSWSGDLVGRLYITTKYGSPITPTLLPTVTGISGSKVGTSFTATWPAIYGAKRYFVFHSHTPISLTPTVDPAKMNWWACDVMSVDATSLGTQTVILQTDQTTPLHVTIVTMDTSGKLTEPSAVAIIN